MADSAPSATATFKYERMWGVGKADQRNEGQRDRDRVLYTSALRRLAGVTQVVAPLEGHIFHNRLTHTIEVEQVARRLAEKLKRETDAALQTKLGEIDVDVVEAAALAHDLGHPPFGHIAEHELDKLARGNGAPDGFEGNAQSFRILTKLAAHNSAYTGLNLTRATLNAVLKYPWHRDLTTLAGKHFEKFGAYLSEDEDFAFARRGTTHEAQSIEAAIMDVADEIVYSVHDVDDCYRAGLIPLEHLRSSEDERLAFFARWKNAPKRGVTEVELDKHRDAIEELLEVFPAHRRYSGVFEQRAELRAATSRLIRDFIFAVSIDEPDANGKTLKVSNDRQFQMRFLQRLLWDYVIDNPRLATQQFGQRRVIRTLFDTYLAAIQAGDRRLLPQLFADELDEIVDAAESPELKNRQVRLAVDIVASLADQQAVILYSRITGASLGSVTDLLS